MNVSPSAWGYLCHILTGDGSSSWNPPSWLHISTTLEKACNERVCDSIISHQIQDTVVVCPILPSNHTLPGDYYSTKKLVKNLGLPVEKIHACKNGCILYWNDNVDLEYCKFCGDARYKPSRERDLYQKKSPYAVLRKLHNVRCTDGFAPHALIDVYMEPLIEELLQLWHVDVRTYDCHRYKGIPSVVQ
ncbi:UNVERIFIED_CONTAM: hypothetical protein Scaly_2853800 [Sesamum calycinum]|uniref:Uncharacterized protein n=1 Tax=Sesamum calycinum TaxID=2727403 RepID=A0AAW2LJ64_9LAMI